MFSDDRKTILAAALAVLLGCILGGGWLTSREVNQGDWRRTAAGWERTGGWHSTTPRTIHMERPLPSQTPTIAKTSRLDTHPAVLALLQLVATLLALSAFPRGSTATSPLPDRWTVFLARSFRASAFG